MGCSECIIGAVSKSTAISNRWGCTLVVAGPAALAMLQASYHFHPPAFQQYNHTRQVSNAVSRYCAAKC